MGEVVAAAKVIFVPLMKKLGGSKVLGNIVGGIGSGLMQKAQAKQASRAAEEARQSQARIDEEARIQRNKLDEETARRAREQQAKIDAEAAEKAEADRVAEEERRAARYAGAGEAVRFWEDEADERADPLASSQTQMQRVDPNSNQNQTLGTQEQTQVLGQQYRTPKPQAPRYRYDPKAGGIVLAQ